MSHRKQISGNTEHFTKLIRSTMDEPAWRALSSSAQALYPWLKLEWRGSKANNNGKIRLSVRQAAERMGVTSVTSAKAFHDLQAKGFLVMTELAHLGIGGQAKSPSYEITELGMAFGENAAGRKLYKNWSPGHDFPVHKPMANNPKGHNGKKKPCHRNDDSTVIDFRMKSP